MAASAREYLRIETQAQHVELDQALSGSALERLDGYRRFLWINAQLAPLEMALEAAGIEDDVPDWSRRTRRQALAADLADLGVDPGPLADPGIDLASRAARLGLAYVLEGSRLGAVVVGRIVAGSTDPASRQATRFLRHGEGDGLWRSFLPYLETGLAAPSDREAGGGAARAGFGVFLRRAAAFEPVA